LNLFDNCVDVIYDLINNKLKVVITLDVLWYLVAAYILVINIVAVFLTVSDKKKAQKNRWRVPEATLLLVSALGGSVAMYITMKKIRHKTKHAKFMIGIPVIMICQVLLIVGLCILL